MTNLFEGYYYIHMNKKEKAKQLFKKSMEILEKTDIEMSQLYFNTLQDIADISIDLGELDDVLFYINKAKILQLT